MQIFDIVILLVVLAMAIWGAIKGFVSQIISIIALILGIYLASRFATLAGEYVKQWLSLDMALSGLRVILFIIILVSTIILGYFTGKAIEGIVKISMLDWLNKLLGFVFSALKAMLVLALLFYFFNYLNSIFNFVEQSLLNTSKAYNILSVFAAKLFPYLTKVFA